MACERCGTPAASDGVNLGGEFSAPNGRKFYIVARLVASSSKTGATAARFCSPCWLEFLRAMVEAGAAVRVSGGTSAS